MFANTSPFPRLISSSMEAGNRTDDENTAKRISKSQKRISLKSRSHFDYPLWKQKLRENCLRRVREDRSRLLWRFRILDSQSSDEKEFIQSALQDIVSDEMKKMKDSSRGKPSDSDDILWEYDGIKDASYHGGDSEEMLLEMQKIFYEELVSTTKGGSCVQMETWEEEEDDYLGTLVFENMHLNHQEERNQIWCPICKQGEVMENQRHVYCNTCEMQLNKEDGVNLDTLQQRLAETHLEHLEKGCRLKPKFCVQSRFNLKALYITCQGCSSFDVVL